MCVAIDIGKTMRLKCILSVLSITLTTLFASSTIAKSINKIKFQQVDEADNLSQLIRSNAIHYWTFAKNISLKDPIQPFLTFKGVIAGDPHLGNFSVIPITIDGKRHLKYLNIDFDDAGRGPFALDFTRLVVASEAITSDVKKSEMLEAYLLGLQGKKMEVPEIVQDSLEMSLSDYDEIVKEYVENKIIGEKFKLKPEKLEPFNFEVPLDTIKKVFADYEFLDAAVRPKEKGGTASLRIWVLVKDKSQMKRIFELKEYSPSGLNSYGSQPSIDDWVHEVRETFWPKIDKKSYDLVNLGTEGWFWVREKKMTLIDIPYSNSKQKKIDFIKELANYDAYILGLAHGSQSSAKGYLAMILKDQDSFHSAFKAIAKTYLQLAKDTFEK